MKKEFWKDKKIFLTGHTGFKGGWLSLLLHCLGAKVTGYALEAYTKPSFYTLASINEKVDRSILGDICDFELLNNKLQTAEPDIVIHMAAQALIGDSYANPLRTYQTNVMGTVNILEAVRHCKSVRAVLIVTTDKCYENREWCWGYRENDTLGGYDPYSSSKACAELVAAAYRQSFCNQDGIRIATVRAGNVIGGGDWSKDRLIPDCLKSIEKGQKVVVRNPESMRPWQHVLEPLRGYLMLTEKLYEDGDRWTGGWNFGPLDSDIITVGDLVKRLCRKLEGEYKFSKNMTIHEATYLKLDSSKARMHLGWSPVLNIDTSLNYIVEWFNEYRKQGDLQALSFKQIEKYLSNIGKSEYL